MAHNSQSQAIFHGVLGFDILRGVLGTLHDNYLIDDTAAIDRQLAAFLTTCYQLPQHPKVDGCHIVHADQEVEPQSVAELLDQADKEDLDPEAYGKGTDDDAAMIDKLRTNGAADRYAMDTPPAL